ncbi:hypothetical protein B0T18DRAFT_370076 [Schizothecium vesticola]|uniref:WW domain-containing protein n=1 Tax=Schizothecium vesticola TaxID=314040 RepID=A0AA40ENK8_9PEZI|nr:hypothetical protein B0T18DRAFT_370076 [Schizothecium vesticola]
MLKSTYKPSAAALQPLLPGWTEHKAPTGHTYYYNAATKESTYKRPAAPFAPTAIAPQVNLSDPNIANAFLAQNAPQPSHQSSHRGGFGGERGGRGGFQPRPRPQPTDKPRSKVAIPGHEPWILVYTKLNRRFAYNPVKKASYWRIPEKLMPAILELDQARIRQKAIDETAPTVTTTGETTVPNRPGAAAPATTTEPHDYDSSEYEEVEVTDSEDDDPSRPKRQRTSDDPPSGPVEFTEADIAAQLAAMNADYNSYPSDSDQDEDDGPPPLSESDATALFHDLLTDLRINPYTPFATLLEQPTTADKLTSDLRYLVLATTRARKEAWETWSRARMQALKDERARQEKTDPRIGYLEFLQENATPKLYWPEFRRKYKKIDCMKDGGAAFGDKEREKLYREYIARVKTSVGERKGELKGLLAGQGARALNSATVVPEGVPAAVRADVRWVVLDRKTRDEFVEGYVRGLGPPPEDEGQGTREEEEAAEKAREERRKRERALEDRERAVAEEKRRQEKRLGFERARLREEERELEKAMVVDKKGLRGQLAGERMEE